MKRFTLTATIDLPDGVFAEAKALTALEEWLETHVKPDMPDGVVLSQEVFTRKERAKITRGPVSVTLPHHPRAAE